MAVDKLRQIPWIHAFRHAGKTADVGKHDADGLLFRIHISNIPLQLVQDRFGDELFQSFLDVVFLDLGAQFGVVEGFGQETVDACIHRLDGALHGGVTRQNDPGNLRVEAADLDQSLQTVETRHLVIGNDRFNITFVLPYDLDGFLAVFRR